MRVIIAGSRTGTLDRGKLRAELERLKATEVVHGCARGIDSMAARVGYDMGLLVTPFPAAWDDLGPAAGPMRNRKMAQYVGPAGACILYPGGRGTQSMRREAKKAGVPIVEMPG